ncbi:MAG: phasin family protein [Pseudomonadota bacterium]
MPNTPEFEIPPQLREFAQKSVNQSQEAYNKLLEASKDAQEVINKSSDAMTTGVKDIQEKAMTFATHNMQANFDLADQLIKAKDMQQALEIQSEFAKQQMEAYAEQTQELSELVAKTAKTVKS